MFEMIDSQYFDCKSSHTHKKAGIFCVGFESSDYPSRCQSHIHLLCEAKDNGKYMFLQSIKHGKFNARQDEKS